ncbi:hypothetical protein QPK87_02010 [Kamptonema cortianum]|nr:hypothetical protein [Kamptonema cortianum]
MVDKEKYWRGRAAQFAREYFFAWWLQSYLIVFFFVASLTALLLIAHRRYELSIQYPVVTAIVLLAICLPVCIHRVRSRRLSARDALACLDDANGLHNRLTAADAGVGSWPEPPQAPLKKPFLWNARVIAATLGVSLVLPLLALWIPVGKKISLTPAPTTPPGAWAQVEEWINELKESQITEPEAIEQFESQLDALRKQDPRDWYSHNSLEAGDNLRNRLDQSLGALERDLQNAQSTLGTLAENKDHLSQTQMEELSAALDQALDGLKMGNLPLNKELAEKLADMNAQNLKQLSPEQMKQLQQALKKCQSKAQDILDGKGQSTELRYDAELGQGEGRQGQGERPGSGGISRGRADAPLVLGAEGNRVDLSRTEELTNDDLRNAALGDSLGVSIGQHRPDDGKAPALNPSAGVW